MGGAPRIYAAADTGAFRGCGMTCNDTTFGRQEESRGPSRFEYSCENVRRPTSTFGLKISFLTSSGRLAKRLPCMPFPSKTKEEHFNYEALMNKNVRYLLRSPMEDPLMILPAYFRTPTNANTTFYRTAGESDHEGRKIPDKGACCSEASEAYRGSRSQTALPSDGQGKDIETDSVSRIRPVLKYAPAAWRASYRN